MIPVVGEVTQSTDMLEEIVARMKRGGGAEVRDSDLMRAFESYVSKEGIRGKTTITAKQRNMIYGYDLLHKKYPNRGFKDAAENLAQLLISEKGPDNSRKQMINLFEGLLRARQPEMQEGPTQSKSVKGTRF